MIPLPGALYPGFLDRHVPWALWHSAQGLAHDVGLLNMLMLVQMATLSHILRSRLEVVSHSALVQGGVGDL